MYPYLLLLKRHYWKSLWYTNMYLTKDEVKKTVPLSFVRRRNAYPRMAQVNMIMKQLLKNVLLNKNRISYNANGQFPNCQSWAFITVHGHF